MIWQKIKDNKPLIFLAPMEGVVDSLVRELWPAYFGGIDAAVCEFIRVTDQLLPDHVFYKINPELKNQSCTASGLPVVTQLLGGRPEWVALNAQKAIELGATAIDLNFGCPAPTVNRHDGGAALLKNPERVYQVTKAVREAVPSTHAVSAKVRLGFSDKSQFLEIAHAAESAGASWLTVHARTRDEGYCPPAHWEYTARIREAIKIPVIANGEVWSVADYMRCREVTGCHHVMIGRGLMTNPFLALNIVQILTLKAGVYGGDHERYSLKQFNFQKQFAQLLEFLPVFTQKNLEARGEKYAVARTKQLLRYFALKTASHDIESLGWQKKWLEIFDHVKVAQTYHECLSHLSIPMYAIQLETIKKPACELAF